MPQVAVYTYMWEKTNPKIYTRCQNWMPLPSGLGYNALYKGYTMKWFRKMVDTVKLSGIDGDKLNPNIYLFLDSIHKAEVFIFSPLCNKEQTIIPETPLELDAPFNVFSIELSDNDQPITSSSRNEIFEQGFDARCYCVLVVELEPKSYCFFSLMEGRSARYLNGKPMFQSKWGVLCSKSEIQLHNHCSNLVKEYISRIAREESGFQKVKEKIKLKRYGRTVTHTIKKLIHITPKKNREAYHPISASNINWSHRWSVRGHWMRTKGVGKDREGNYCVEGFTWRNAHIKGPEEMPLVKKQRLVT